MITISRFVDRPRAVFALPGYTWAEAYGTPLHSYPVWTFLPSTGPYVTTFEHPNRGFKKQGRKVRGRMNERGVYHLKTSGEIRVADQSLLGEVYSKVPRAYRNHGTVIEDSIPWGSNYLYERVVEVPAGIEWGVTFTRPWVVSSSVRFVNSCAIRATGYKTSQGTYYDRDGNSLGPGAPGMFVSTSIVFLLLEGETLYELVPETVYHGAAEACIATFSNGVTATGTFDQVLYTLNSVVDWTGVPKRVVDVPSYTLYKGQSNEDIVTAISRSTLRVGDGGYRITDMVTPIDPSTGVGFDFGTLAADCYKQFQFVSEDLYLFLIDLSNPVEFADTITGAINKFSLGKASVKSLSATKLGKDLGPTKAKVLSTAIHGDTWFDTISRFDPDNPVIGRIITMGKKAASNHLEYLFFWKPTVNDITAITNGVKKFLATSSEDRFHSRKRIRNCFGDPHVSYLAVATVVVDPYPIGEGSVMLQNRVGWLKRFGVWPGRSTAWDVIPFSFLVNNLLPVSKALKAQQTHEDMEFYFPVKYVVLSEKWTVVLDASEIVGLSGASGEVRTSYYTRWIEDTCPLPPVDVSAGTPGIARLSSTGAELVVQRLRGSRRH